jgi:hypothetical protein
MDERDEAKDFASLVPNSQLAEQRPGWPFSDSACGREPAEEFVRGIRTPRSYLPGRLGWAFASAPSA